ncbi:hypothetical protein QMZ92_23870 [Streptomyces sp. HNM0645]|uniref:hypothetical protein n=1 Tax=Streptomyces sp. HNM0645 TaxID=2782343 RepID=UPI0024B7098D|nr:hypothetical protein [Streptomyces sp. HNM0645]MDI9887324.1 hypothetical protein [Streptomyces sp. HNM0645]
MTDRIVIDLDRDGWTNSLQLNMAQLDENDTGCGYRLHGPKYNGSSKNLIRHVLDERDANEIRQMLDAVFPPKTAAELETLRARVAELETAAYGDTTVRLLDPVGQIRHLHDALAAQMARAETLDRLLREKQRTEAREGAS